MISVQRISETRCISVHPVNYSEEFLHMYFENPKRSGGCTSCVSSVKTIPDKDIAIVTFSKPSGSNQFIFKINILKFIF